ncbi:MAG: metallophosphoesterase [Saprospiraceae bacterium]|nr:metallophosphoesterase [Saprospiraceae bacterium]MCF8249564.1 metallophosphoesterase [Saprospiraceae bacterium]MCF8280464.1 metallophosphoesterase [Bacteroidales bacterium]MCF8310396.1 metallophosphoesterase [Saprospiraceae bacterium]MCF8439774.1 metallophosphoesterase [Saprospiraceae bacterium]
MRQFAISDIHGCNISFNALLDKIGLTTTDELYLLGDYIDRGPDSKGVLDTIIRLQSTGYKMRCLVGNHDEAILKARQDRKFYLNWVDGWGGEQTLESFSAFQWDDITPAYWAFFKSLEDFIVVDGYILVHAGLDFKLADPLIVTEEMRFIRDWYGDIDYDWLGSRCIVHGHTPVTVQQAETLLENIENHQVIDIDTGCFADNRIPGKGYLCAFDMTNRQLFFQNNMDDVSGFWAGRS